jgi:hypothetical protein
MVTLTYKPFILSVIMLNIIMPSVVMLSVVAPQKVIRTSQVRILSLKGYLHYGENRSKLVHFNEQKNYLNLKKNT